MQNKCRCDNCNKVVLESEIIRTEHIRSKILETIMKTHPQWSQNSKICENCLNDFRVLHLQKIIEDERGELSSLDLRVLESLKEHEIISRNVGDTYSKKLSLGEKLSDKLASFGGSWFFLIFFCCFLCVWIVLNVYSIKGAHFDPYPFILLNLILSCIAALQAPIIMMSQNRQEAKDRIRNEHDYEVNLKAELEIRQLHMKIDQMLKHQWNRLFEIQQLQVEMIQAQKRFPSKNT